MNFHKLAEGDEDYLHPFSSAENDPHLKRLGVSFKKNPLYNSLKSNNCLLVADDRPPKIIIELAYLPWDSEILGIKTAKIQIFQHLPNGHSNYKKRVQLLNAVLEEASKIKIKFLYVKLPANSIEWINLFENVGFRIKDNEIVMLHNNTIYKDRDKSGQIRIIRNPKGLRLDNLSTLFGRSRLTNDIRINDDVINKLWGQSIDNCCKSNKDILFYAEHNGVSAGILSLKRETIKNENIFSIFLLGVYEDFQRKGIASTLFSEAIQYVQKRSKYLIVETQTYNYSAIEFYNHIGFKRIIESRICMHCWL